MSKVLPCFVVVLCILTLLKITPSDTSAMTIPDTAVYVGPGIQANASVAVGEDLTIYVVWIAEGIDRDTIFFSKSIDGGITFSSPVWVSECHDTIVGVGDYTDVRIRVHGSGSTAIVHIVNNRTSPPAPPITFEPYNTIMYTRSTDGGVTFECVFRSHDFAQSDIVFDFDLDVDPANYVYIVYSKPENGVNLFMIVSSDGGSTFGPRFTIADSSIDEVNPAIALEGSGATSTAHVAWGYWDGADQDVCYRPVFNAGDATRSLGATQMIADSSILEMVKPGGIAVDRLGRIYIAFTQTDFWGTSTTTIELRYADPLGIFNPPVILHGPLYCGSVVLDVDWYGNPYLVWNDEGGTDEEILMTYSTDRGITFVPTFLVNDDPVGTEQQTPAIAIWADECERWISIVWHGDQLGDDDIYHTGLHQYYNIIKPVVAPGGFSAGNQINLEYTTWNQIQNATLTVNVDSLIAWLDVGSEISASQLATGSWLMERWIIHPDSDWVELVDTTCDRTILTYYHQLGIITHVRTLPPGIDMTAGNHIPLHGTAFGTEELLATLWDDHPETIYVDRLGQIRYDSLSTGSNALQRWTTSTLALIYTVLSHSTHYWVAYFHQLFSDLTLEGTDATHTVDITDRTYFDTRATAAGLFGNWSGWSDYSTMFTIDDTTTGIPYHWTTDPTSWLMTTSMIDTIHYIPTVIDVNFAMTALTAHCIFADWNDMYDELWYFVTSYWDSLIVPSADTLPANTIFDTICGLDENTLYRWFLTGLTAIGGRYSLDDSIYTLCEPPTEAAVLDTGSDFAVLTVDPFPNHTAGASGYFWDCVVGEALGGRDTTFFDGTTLFLMDNLGEGFYKFYVFYMNGDGIMTAEYDSVIFFIDSENLFNFMGLHAGWNLIAMSLVPIPPTPVQIFQDDIYPFLLTPINSNLYFFNEPTSLYNIPAVLECGLGYWLYLWHLVGVDVFGNSINDEFLWNLSYSTGAVHPGWHCFGNPYKNRAIDWNTILADPQTFNIDNTYYAWTEFGWAFYNPLFPGGVGRMIPPWRGIEIQALGPGATLHIQYPLTLPPSRMMRRERDDYPAEVDWFLRISTSIEDCYDKYNYIINSESASPGIDQYDFVEKPPVAAGYLCTYFPQYNPERGIYTQFTSYSNNFSSEDAVYEIPFQVQTNAGEEVSISWEFSGLLTEDYQLFLRDEVTGTEFDMLETESHIYSVARSRVIPAEVKHHFGLGSFAFNEDDCHQFTITIYNACTGVKTLETNLPTRLAIERIFPNPFNSLTRIEYAVPDNEQWVSIVIYDLLGNVTKVLKDGSQQAGFHTKTWDGRDAQGYGVSSGLYFCVLRQGSESIVKKVFLLK